MPTHQGNTQTDIVIGSSGDPPPRGRLITVLPKQRFDFSFLGASSSTGLVLVSALDVIPYKSAWLLVRCHSATIGTGAMIDVKVFGTDPSRSDPQEFTYDTELMSVRIDSSSSPPELLTDNDSNLYPFLKIGLLATQGSSGGASLYAEISAELVVREA